MYFTPQLRNCFHVMKFVLRGQVCFEKCTLQRLSYTTRALGNHALKDDISASEKEKVNCFNISGKFLLKSPYTPWSPEPASHKSHSHQHEPGGGGQGWRLASLLALSLISTKTEAEEAEKRESELIIMIKRGILALKGGELNKAEQLLHVALKMAQETNNEQAVTYIFDLLANLAYQREQYPKAQRLFKDVLQRLLSGGMAEDDNAVVEISLKLASVYASEGDYEKAVQGFQFCIATQEEKISKHGEANLDEDSLLLWAMSMDWYARFLLNLHKFELAKQHFLKAYEMSVRVSGPLHSQTAVLLNDIGSVCSLQKNYTEAVDYLEKAIAAARESESPEIGSFYVNLGTVFLQQGLHGEAKRCCREGLALSKKLKNKDGAEEAEICLTEIEKVIKGEKSNKV